MTTPPAMSRRRKPQSGEQDAPRTCRQSSDAKRPSQEAEQRSASRGDGLEPAPWERLLEESPKAYAAFRAFLDQGAARSYAGVARALRKHESQIRRWAGRFVWLERAHAWDLAQSREVELLLRQEREQQARRRLRHGEQLERMAMAGLAQLVTRDPETGEPKLSPALTPSLLVRCYELSLKISNALPSPQIPETPSGEAPESMMNLADPVLQQVIKLAEEFAHKQQPQEEHKDGQSAKRKTKRTGGK